MPAGRCHTPVAAACAAGSPHLRRSLAPLGAEHRTHNLEPLAAERMPHSLVLLEGGRHKRAVLARCRADSRGKKVGPC